MSCEIIYTLYNNNYNILIFTFYIIKFNKTVYLMEDFMGKNLNKTTIILLSIGLISLLLGTFLGIQLTILLFLILLLTYLIITKKHYLKLFKGMKAYKLEYYTTAL